MSDWKRIEIGRSSYLRGRIGWQGLRAEEFIEEGPFLVTGTDFQNGKIDWSTCYHVGERRFREASYIHLKDGDLLITKDGTIGKIAQVDNCPEQAVLNSGVFLLRCADGSYRHRFLYHVLRSFIFEDFLRLNLAGSTITHLYQYVFERFDFSAPSLEDQDRICGVLDLLEQQITHTEALIAKQEQVRAGLMQDLFTRGVDETGRLRPPREEAPALYHETALGWLPKGWSVNRLAELASAEITYGIVQAGLHVPDGVPYIRTGDMFGRRLSIEELMRTSTSIAAQYERSRVRAGETVIAIRATVGKALQVPDELHGANLTQGTARFAPNPTIRQEFALWLVRSNHVQADIAMATKGTTFSEITLSDLRMVRAAFPINGDEQSRIACALNQLERYWDELLASRSKLHNLRSALLRDLLTPPAAAAAEPRIAAE